MLIIERYIIRNHINPFIFSLSILTFMFIMDFVLRYIDPFLKKGIDFGIVLQVFFLSLGHMFALIIPMAVLPATIMAFGNLASENEVTAMKANGISIYRMVLPGLLVAALLAIGMVIYNNHLLPESNHKLRNLLVDIYKKKPSVRIKKNSFIDAFKGYTIYVREKDDQTGEIRDVQIFKHNQPSGLPTTIVAEKGRMKYLEKEHLLRFELENGEIHEMPEANDASTYRKTTFKHYVMTIEDIDRTLKRSERSYRGDREMSAKQMANKIDDIKKDIKLINSKMIQSADHRMQEVFKLLDLNYRRSLYTQKGFASKASVGESHSLPHGKPNVKVPNAPEGFLASNRGRKEYIIYKALESQREIKYSYFKQIDRYKVEIHKKFSIPFACIVFVLIGAPLAIKTGKAGVNTAVGLSITFFLLYYVSLIGGEKLADRGIISPFMSMWGANMICTILGVFLLRSTTREQSSINWSKINPLRLLHFAR